MGDLDLEVTGNMEVLVPTALWGDRIMALDLATLQMDQEARNTHLAMDPMEGLLVDHTVVQWALVAFHLTALHYSLVVLPH